MSSIPCDTRGIKHKRILRTINRKHAGVSLAKASPRYTINMYDASKGDGLGGPITDGDFVISAVLRVVINAREKGENRARWREGCGNTGCTLASRTRFRIRYTRQR